LARVRSLRVGAYRTSPTPEAGSLHLPRGPRYPRREQIRWVTRSGRLAGGGCVEPRGRGVGQSTGFEAMAFMDGRVRVSCPAHPGNA